MNIDKTKHLLSSTALIIKHQKEVARIKGETFNVFSILKMESRETVSHTPFLAELLNPTGTHLMGNIFLKLFLSIDKIKSLEKTGSLNAENIKVHENKFIGPCINDDGNESGGFLDIYLVDNNNRSITIENKIDEKTEQHKQVVRYVNYNKANNIVFYLTPSGKPPSEKSKGTLECGKDFYLLSYQTDIIDWLKLCLKETGDNIILRQTIRQYIILLQKITHTMDNKEAIELNNLMLNHFEEASFIAANFEKAKTSITEEIRQQVGKILGEKLGTEFNIKFGLNTSNRDSPIWIKYNSHNDSELFFGVESFSPYKQEEMYVGIFSFDGKHTEYKKEDFSKENFWPIYYTLKSEDSADGICLFDGKVLQRINSDTNFRNRLVETIVSQVEKFIAEHNKPLLSFLRTQVHV